MKSERPVTAAYPTEAFCISQEVHLSRLRHQFSVFECLLSAISSRTARPDREYSECLLSGKQTSARS